MSANSDIAAQRSSLQAMLLQNPHIAALVEQAHRICLPNWYLGAGCIAQTVWNLLSGRTSTEGIKDLDLVYFDATDLTETAEAAQSRQVCEILSCVPMKIDVKNQARVHVWYEAQFGYPIRPYTSVEDAVNSWPTTATAVGVRPGTDGFTVYAPFGLNDLFGRIIRPNKRQITEAIYRSKIKRWLAQWPGLTIIPW